MRTRSGRPTTAKKVPRGSLKKSSATKVPVQAQKSLRAGSSKDTSPVIQDERSLETVTLPSQAKRSVSLTISQRRRLSNAKELSAPSQIKKLTTKHCCKLKCFQKVDRDQLCDDMKKVAHMNQKDRRHFLQSLFVQEFETYRYGGRRVCYKFLNQTFRFSIDMQWKTKMKLIGASASQPVESPDSELGSASDSEKQPEIDEQDQLHPEESDDMVNIDEQDQLRPEESDDMVNTFVAVKGTGCSAEEPFWLAKVKGVERGKKERNVLKITVEWMEKKDGNALTCRYEPCLRRNGCPWVDHISPDSVILEIPELLDGRLDSYSRDFLTKFLDLD